MTMPRPEYPRPQFVRRDWLCLNGVWEFETDRGDSGLQRGLLQRPLAQEIQVPFCPESTLSGIGEIDYLQAVWYRKRVELPANWQGHRILLHFQAVDYDATVWVNGRQLGTHRGGFSPFSFDLQGVAEAGECIEIVVRARDNHRQQKPMGKQSSRFANNGCHYTRTTGIWQTVWLEPVSQYYLKRPRITTDPDNACFLLELPLNDRRKGLQIEARLRDRAGVVNTASVAVGNSLTPQLRLEIPRERLRLWSPEDPHLYPIEIVLKDRQGDELDRLDSYGGLRSTAMLGNRLTLNGAPVFQRLVLDQGYYPDGIMTAPTDEALIKDIELSLGAGFNGARLHQKVFEERFLYHADRMGYLVWGEFADWFGNDIPRREFPNDVSFVAQWLEVLERDYAHPCIVGWCPLNETHQTQRDEVTTLDDITLALFLATKTSDRTRPVLDASGYIHRVPESDVYDSHDYSQKVEEIRERHKSLVEGKPFVNQSATMNSVPYRGQPYFISEFGGIWWNAEAAAKLEMQNTSGSWGYGERPRTIEEFYARFEALCTELLRLPDLFGYCYTQLTDVFQEQNGIFAFDRSAKFDLERIRRIQRQTAAYERESGASGS